ncbi:TRAP transporter small permease subunit [Motiliproteus sp. MSK22-1]|uniref:TRAP transporter small permease subunit n=1 Tax=Motiliproteus sp. MSK22-1 TaxID=1897630 RepID=UPI0009761382|nr:TRAP transporter small permease subunit [Motiliproteus sp. MSK22-1]OMH30329.1 C4-dicarboxylate ABC transporter [Motiliproteus sp. MSK22-1]
MTDNNKSLSVPISDSIDAFIRKVGHGIAWVYVLLVLVIITQVILRKGFSSGLIVLEELQWHLYAMGVMFGISYAQVNNAHIRVDLFYGGFRQRTKYIIEIIGIILLVLPFIYVIFSHSLDFVADSWRINESSSSPSGLPWRWAIKSVIPVSFGLLGLAVISRLIRDFVLLVRGEH